MKFIATREERPELLRDFLRKILPLDRDQPGDLWAAGSFGLDAFGPMAEGAIPDLIEMAGNAPPGNAEVAFHILGRILDRLPEGAYRKEVLQLCIGLTDGRLPNRDGRGRWAARTMLHFFPEDAKGAGVLDRYPELAEALNNALQAITNIAQSLKVASK
ncbi:MAG TPA: hypothetical protein VMF06_05250 [Candidatus Limnocylindria bacterium]|nr:hypothetical protein [Candidatus Limnocylindria bacterium]